MPAERSWTFLTNHAHVLLAISAAPDLRLKDIAERVDITERTATQILSELEHTGASNDASKADGTTTSSAPTIHSATRSKNTTRSPISSTHSATTPIPKTTTTERTGRGRSDQRRR